MLRLIAQKSMMSPIRYSLFGRVLAQEIEQPLGLARPRAEVDVGEKNGSDLGHEGHDSQRS
jgi:hypothetical protein